MTVEELIEELQRVPNKRVPALTTKVVRNSFGDKVRVEIEIDSVRWVGHGALLEKQ